MFSSLLICSLVLPVVYVWGSGSTELIFFVNSWPSFYAGASFQVTTLRIECSGLCSKIWLLIEGANVYM